MNPSASSNPLARWRLAETAGREVVDEVTGRRDRIHSAVPEPAAACGRDPLRRPGPALDLDGYSTWITRPAAHVPHTECLTVDVWFAPAADGAAGLVSRLSGEPVRGYHLGLLDDGRPVFRIAVADGVREAASSRPLRHGVWNHCAGTYDAATGEGRLYVDGVLASTAHGAPAPLLAPDADLRIGRGPGHGAGEFCADAACGLLGPVTLYGDALAPSEVAALQRKPPSAAPDVRVPARRFADDPHRPGYHFMPPRHWMNEPHAPLHHQGLHHIFYQHNPRGPYWSRITWGHAVSKDLVTWRHLPTALTPATVPVAPQGIWSGSATTGPDGTPALFFTAGDDRRTPNQCVGLARPADTDDVDLTRWVTRPAPVVELDTTLRAGDGDRQGPVLAGEFRDPFVWREDGSWFMLVGSGVEGVGGTCLLYESGDLEQWSLVGPFTVGDVSLHPETGVMWELPVLLPLGTDERGRTRHVFLVSPWWPEPGPHSLTYAWYWIGTWDAASRTWTPDDPVPRHFDYGAHFTGPTGTVDAAGRALLWSIAQDRRSDADHHRSGWAHNAGLPLQLSLGDDGDLRIAPVAELSSLREPPLLDLRDVSAAEAGAVLASCVRGDMLEIALEAELPDSARLELAVRRSPDGHEATSVTYDAARGAFGVDRSRTGGTCPEVVDVREGPLALKEGLLSLRVFVDRSMVEAYANERRSITTRTYPARPDALGLALTADSEVRVRRLTVWPLRPADAEQQPTATATAASDAS
ncbi:GH32 C-terminal domain-containing protein [Streptomyces xantholiticus]|uniref:beta-fructofuranosidase n=1 Tax=Streptomyces xantholiticus TaxID=68285 RepID=A0ABV1UUQ1_9ACTN